MNICLFEQEEISKPLNADDPRAQHIIKILHKSVGDTFSAGVIGGQAGTATITKIDGAIHFTFTPQSDGKPLFPLHMIIGFPRPIQLKRLLRDMAALGVSSVRLCGTELGEKSYLKASLSDPAEVYKMLLDGTVQAASTHVPRLVVRRSLGETLKEELSENELRVALDNRRAVMSLHGWLEKNFSDGEEKKSVVAAIGSERGWTENERDLLESAGFALCSMGKRVLRTETAATVASSIILDKLGFLD